MQLIYNLFILVLLASHLWELIVCAMWCLNFLYDTEKVIKYFKNKDIFYFAHLFPVWRTEPAKIRKNMKKYINSS